MGFLDKTPAHPPRPDDSANQSVLGEEDPGAAVGGADGDQALKSSKSGEVQTEVDLTNAELVQLQVRVIALENLVIALLAEATPRTTDLARAMAADISPRPGCTPHHLTIHAAAQMVHLVERSALFRNKTDS
ncbi:MAG: hypothetical protein WKG52_01195 [Variovorax sp.]